MDDGTFIVPASRATAFLAHVRTLAAAHGGELNVRKCVAYCKSGELPPDLCEMGIKAIDSRVPAAERGLVMQVVPLGHDDYVQGFLTKNLRAQVELTRRLSTYVPNRHAAAQILISCVTPRVHHLLRALPPSLS